MRIACWIPKATNILSEYPLGYRIKFQLPFNNIKWLSDYSRRWQVKGYVKLIGFPLQKYLQERAAVLRLYAHYLLCYVFIIER
jgi:hypothetical protein